MGYGEDGIVVADCPVCRAGELWVTVPGDGELAARCLACGRRYVARLQVLHGPGWLTVGPGAAHYAAFADVEVG